MGKSLQGILEKKPFALMSKEGKERFVKAAIDVECNETPVVVCLRCGFAHIRQQNFEFCGECGGERKAVQISPA